jgi:hypothetical protein
VLSLRSPRHFKFQKASALLDKPSSIADHVHHVCSSAARL